MNLETLSQTLQKLEITLPAAELEANWQQFQAETAAATLPAFALWLHARARLDHTDLSRILTEAPVQLEPAPQGAEPFTLLGSIGRGGMGEILLARDNHLLRTVASKRLLPELADSPAIRAQFLQEVQITSQLEHPNVVPVYSFDSGAGLSYSMKLVRGQTLKQLIQEARQTLEAGHPLPDSHSLPTLLEYFLQVCSALEFAHSRGVLHRDLKPANIMIGKHREVAVMDWGIACLIGAGDSSRQAIGTPRYMSPEQAGGLNDRLDARSDLYSLGLILFELVSLRPAALQGKTLIETLKHTIKGELNALEPPQPGGKIPPELRAIIARATARKRDQRYASVAELSADLRRYLRGEAVLARPDTPLQKVLRLISQNREKTLVALLGLFLMGALLLSFSFYERQRSLQAARRHEEQIHQAVNLVARHGHRLDQHFFSLESLLRSYGTAVLQLLEHGRPTPGRFYTLNDYRDPQRRPPATDFVPAYQTAVNVDWGVILSAPNADPLLMRDLALRLHPLQTLMKQIVSDSDPKAAGQTPAEIRARILARKMPVLWIFAGLESGFYIGYPSTYNYPAGYDPRRRPWYRMGKGLKHFRWREPYRTTGGEIDLPCVMPLYDSQNRFQGVAVLEMTFAYIREHLLTLEVPGVIESALVNERGEIVSSSRDRYRAGRQSGLQQKQTTLDRVRVPEIRTALTQKRSGIRLIETPHGREVFIFNYLDSLGWFYLVQARESEFLGAVARF